MLWPVARQLTDECRVSPDGGQPCSCPLKGQGLRWLGFEGESSLAEESGDEGGSSLDAVQLAPHRGGELDRGAGGEVAQAVLHYRPGALDRVEVRGVGHPDWMTVSQSGGRR